MKSSHIGSTIAISIGVTPLRAGIIAPRAFFLLVLITVLTASEVSAIDTKDLEARWINSRSQR